MTVQLPTILVIEDDRQLTEVITELLWHWGYGVVAVDSILGLRLELERSATPFYAVLSDFHLTDGTAIEVLSCLRHVRCDAPTILMTGSLTAEEIAESLDIYLLPKPFAANRLRLLLSQLGDNGPSSESLTA